MTPPWMQSTFVYYAFRVMPRSELVFLLLFLASFTFVYICSAVVSVRWGLRKIRRVPAPKRGKWRRRIRMTVLVLAAVGLLCMLYAWKIEPYWPQVSTWRVETPKLSPGSQPIRIVHISDTHCEGTVRIEERLPDIIAEQRPDLIVFTGDAVNELEGKPVFRRLMTRLAAIAPTYAVRGNWDWESFRGEHLYDGTGANDISGKTVKIPDKPLYFVGLGWPDWEAAKSLQAKVPPGALSVLLYHTPDIVTQLPSNHIPLTVDLTLAGHTHGGQIAMPLYGGMITLSCNGKRFERDMRVAPNGRPIHISRGIGLEGGRAPRMRFFARPDVSVIEIAPSRQ